MPDRGLQVERREALVIGNSDYKGMGALRAPRKDATDMARVLKDLGFNVRLGIDLDAAAMQKEVNHFADDLKERAAGVALLYYSGHGVQVDGVNYLVPIGAEVRDTEALSELIQLDALMALMAANSKVRLVLLDACRNNPFSEWLAGNVLRAKGIYVGEERTPVVPPPGLAEIRADAGTLIAFAAAPGHVAYEGGGDHSAFTEGLLKHIEMSDLSIGNLMIRARNDVLAATLGQQKTWDHSSLTEPFFFNPGSLILIVGNALGIVALLVSFLPQSFLLAAYEPMTRQVGGQWWLLSTLLAFSISAATFGFFLAGLQRAYRLLRGELSQVPADGDQGITAEHTLAWRQVVIGGFFGGVIAAPLMAVPYYASWPLFQMRYPEAWAQAVQALGADSTAQPFLGQVLLEFTLTSIFVGVLLGFGVLGLTNMLLRVVPRASTFLQPLATFCGAVLGGLFAGVAAGAPITLYFVNRYTFFAGLDLLLPGALLGTGVTVFAIANYSLEHYHRRKLRRRLVAAFVSPLLLGAALLAIYVFLGGFFWTHVFEPLEALLVAPETIPPAQAVLGGAMYGAVVGCVLGAAFGLALILGRGALPRR